MRGRHKNRGGTGDPVERLCVGVWLAGNLAAAFTLGSLLAEEHQGHASAQRPAARQPDADLSMSDHEF